MSNPIFIEPLEEDEMIFVAKKYEKASKEYLRIMNLFLIASGLIPLILAISFGIVLNDIRMFYRVFTISLISLITFFCIVSVIFYFIQVYAVFKDKKFNTKTLERCNISKKNYVEINHSFHFYLNSEVKYSIEVTENDFNLFNLGDEINIEYTTFSKEFLGYY